MRTSGARQEQDVACAAIMGTLAELAFGRPAALERLIREASAALPPDIRRDLVSCAVGDPDATALLLRRSLLARHA